MQAAVPVLEAEESEAAPAVVPEKGGYRAGKLLIVPLQGPGCDIFLGKAYFTFLEEGTLPIIFYERVYGLAEFLGWAMDPKNIFLAAFEQAKDDDPDSMELRGISWINRPVAMNAAGDLTKSEIGMGFFRGSKHNLAFARLMLRWLFDHLDLDVIFGTTPEQNRAAVKFARELGFSITGPIPSFTSWHGELTGAWISSLTKQQFLDSGR